MNVRKRNILEIVLQSITLILLVVPGCFINEGWRWKKEESRIYHGVMALEREDPVSCLSAIGETTVWVKIIGILLILALGATIVLMVRQLIGKGKQKNSFAVVIGSAVSCLLFAVLSVALLFTSIDYIEWEYRYSFGWFFYVIAAIYVCTLCVVGIGYLQAKRCGIVRETHSIVQSKEQVNTVDELINYKRLMDMGVITEEEFDQKKKQLMQKG